MKHPDESLSRDVNHGDVSACRHYSATLASGTLHAVQMAAAPIDRRAPQPSRHILRQMGTEAACSLPHWRLLCERVSQYQRGNAPSSSCAVRPEAFLPSVPAREQPAARRATPQLAQAVGQNRQPRQRPLPRKRCPHSSIAARRRARG